MLLAALSKPAATSQTPGGAQAKAPAGGEPEAMATVAVRSAVKASLSVRSYQVPCSLPV
jgi:hypothetical protein